MVSETVGEGKLVSTTQGEGYIVDSYNLPSKKIAENVYEGQTRMVSQTEIKPQIRRSI